MYTRLNYGTTSASELFHEEIRKAIADIHGVFNIHDDILVYSDTKSEHDRILRTLLDRLREIGITANLSKCVFDVNVIDFFGMRFSSAGMEPDPKKIKALTSAEPLKNVSELKSFLGMTNYSSQFICNYSSKTSKLRELLHTGVKWNWTTEHELCFRSLKNSLQSPSVLGYFNVKANTKVIVDASPTGLGAMLIQTQKTGDDKVIAYSSRSLTDAETRYSQLEREALAIYFGCIKFQMYLLGKSFIVHSDHKPLMSMFNNPKKNAPFRVERIRLKLLGFDFQVKHLPGKINPSDYTSRHALPTSPKDETCISDELKAYVNLIVNETIVTFQHLQEASRADDLIHKIITLLESDKYPRKCDGIPSTYVNLWEEFCVVDHVLLRKERIVIPKALQDKVVKVAHEGHLGIVNTKSLLRSKVWFKGLDELVENEIRDCTTGQATVHQHLQEPLSMSVLPNGPWEKVKVDFYGPLPSGDYLLEVIDEYSRWAEVEIVKTTSADSTIPKLDKIFSAFGIPYVVTSDNGPPFKGHDMKNFARYLDIKHRKITPLWPQANAHAETFNRRLRKVVQSAKIEGKNWKQELYGFLRNYMATPHASTGKSPAELMFPGRSYRIRIPQPQPLYDDREVRDKDELSKSRMKKYADSRNNLMVELFHIDDMVLVKQKKLNKLTPPFNPVPHQIIAIKGSMITARCRCITRNSSFFKDLNKKKNKNQPSYIVQRNDTAEISDDDTIISNDINIPGHTFEFEENYESDESDHEHCSESNDFVLENPEIIAPRRNPPRKRNRP